ncbi:MAG TPA: SDR family NAD(P)-dependent oxidoreductase [Caulobacteraceae bacterium]|jgi:NAD(P)-dependent dehydrogenase (short-subunit alcohol dehydrogenase family)|nr:SDR family NAD(P)-dependent oxidoreductase [Caulobacteraceae bacterium]
MSMSGKTVVMTGATSGIGEAAARALAASGARIVFSARDAARADATLALLRRANPDARHDWALADLTTLEGMEAAAKALGEKAPVIDVLANNAGAMFQTREITQDGLEKTFAVDHMAYFIVTERLRPRLAPGGRIVSTASGAHAVARLDLDDLNFERRRYGAFAAYGNAKLCNILFTHELARRLEGSGVTANCFHPGGVATRFGADAKGVMGTLFRLAGRFMLTPEQGADTLIWLASAPEAADQNGGYFVRRRRTQPSAAARNAGLGARLWEVSERIAARAVMAS